MRSAERTEAMRSAEEMPWPETSPMATRKRP
jgi:hypothetical protein